MDWRKIITPLVFASAFCISTGTYVAAQYTQPNSGTAPVLVDIPGGKITVNSTTPLLGLDNSQTNDLQNLADFYNYSIVDVGGGDTLTIDINGGLFATNTLLQARDTTDAKDLVAGTARAAFLFDGNGGGMQGGHNFNNILTLNNTSGSLLTLAYNGTEGQVAEFTNMKDVTIDGGTGGILFTGAKVDSTAYVYGGSRISSVANKVTLNNAEFSDNNISGTGGAGGGGLFLAEQTAFAGDTNNTSAAVLNSVTFKNNKATEKGTTSVLGGGLFINNFSDVMIGYTGRDATNELIPSTATATNKFIGNEIYHNATGTDDARGAGLYVEYNDNYAVAGAQATPVGNYRNMEITGNKIFAASTDDVIGAGMAVYAGWGTGDMLVAGDKKIDHITSNLDQVNISGNEIQATGAARDVAGGGFAAYINRTGTENVSQTVRITNSNFEGNTAKSTHATPSVMGGGLYFDGGLAGGLTVVDTSFNKNKAISADDNSAGGAIYAANGNVEIEALNKTIYFQDNEAEAGAAIAASDNVTIKATGGDVIFKNNKSASGVATLLFDDTSVAVQGLLTYDAAAGRTISDDGHVAADQIDKNGDGTLTISGDAMAQNNININAGNANFLGDWTFAGIDFNQSSAGVTRVTGFATVTGDVNASNGYLKFHGGVEATNLNTTDGLGGRGGIVEFDATQAEIGGNVFTGNGTGAATLGEKTIRISGTTSNPNNIAAVEFTHDDYGKFEGDEVLGNQLRDALNDAIDNTYSQMVTWEADWIAIRTKDNTLSGVGIYDAKRAFANMSDVRMSALMLHNNRAVFGSANDRMTQNFNYWDSMCGARRSSQCGTTCGQSYGRGATHSAWVNYVGRSSELQSSYAHYRGESFDITSNGIQAGLDIVSTSNTQIGVMFGYEDQKSELRRDSVNADDYYFGIYGARRFNNGFDVRASFGYGSQDYDMVRYTPLDVGNNYLSSFDGNTYELNFELGRRFYVSPCFSYRPVLGFDFYWNELDAALETPALAYAVGYGKTKFNQALVRIGSDVQWNFNRLVLNGGLYYSYDMADDDFETDAIEVSGFGNRLRGCDLGTSVLSLNIGGQYYLNQCKTFAVYGGYNADFFLDRDDEPITHTWNAGVQWRF